MIKVKEKISSPEIFCSHLFGVKSEGNVRYMKDEYVYLTYDEIPIISSPALREYAGETLRIMYTGEEYGTGDIVVEDENGKIIYKFKEYQEEQNEEKSFH